jgi:hypothetical protein
LKPDFHLNNILKLSLYLTEHTAYPFKHESLFMKITFPWGETSSVEVKNEWNYASALPASLHGICRDNFTPTVSYCCY